MSNSPRHAAFRVQAEDGIGCANKPIIEKERYMTAKANAFDVGDYVVYPKHGVGRVIELFERQIVAQRALR